ncbi:hypothetical protein B0F90DRAFT_992482 [Multifurca ochricompacta]|uniref:Uncharacterized protein n=1 Tax=Multifurca ochricompacta TaxID=376703 RepID=A0AAD4QLS5_9AGAM|nr:hypothetical protein B0F90DRAFT_992482 [Multifurca ochricompacta]
MAMVLPPINERLFKDGTPHQNLFPLISSSLITTPPTPPHHPFSLHSSRLVTRINIKIKSPLTIIIIIMNIIVIIIIIIIIIYPYSTSGFFPRTTRPATACMSCHVMIGIGMGCQPLCKLITYTISKNISNSSSPPLHTHPHPILTPLTPYLHPSPSPSPSSPPSPSPSSSPSPPSPSEVLSLSLSY